MKTQQTKAYGTSAATTPLEQMSIPRRELQPKDVEVEILFCGVCHTDLHMTRNHSGWSSYPMVPGHEIVGRVLNTGTEVALFKAGDIAAVGVLVDSCRECRSCKEHMEVYCENGLTGTYGSPDKFLPGHSTYGGYSEKVVVDERFVYRVPENLDPAGVAPLLCAGVTTWGPLKHWNVGEGSKVGVVGLGGLGHIAVKLAKGLGAEVTVFSRTPNKAQDALELGADRIIISTDEQQMQQASNSLDLIIDTVPYKHDLNPYLATLDRDGTLVMVGYLGELDSVNSGPLGMRRRAVAGSVGAGSIETQEMLEFCGKKNIVSNVEMINIEDINSAFERLEKGDVKGRFVIDMASLRELS